MYAKMILTAPSLLCSHDFLPAKTRLGSLGRGSLEAAIMIPTHCEGRFCVVFINTFQCWRGGEKNSTQEFLKEKFTSSKLPEHIQFAIAEEKQPILTLERPETANSFAFLLVLMISMINWLSNLLLLKCMTIFALFAPTVSCGSINIHSPPFMYHNQPQ